MQRIGVLLFVLLTAFLISCSKEEFFVFDSGLSSQYIIAHKGNSEMTGCPGNSRASLLNALELDIYGTEFDVRQTKDHVLVICHDKEFDGINIAEANYSEFDNHYLENGENLPTLEEYIEIYKNSQSKVKLIIELKSCSVTDVVELVEQYDLQDFVEFISFELDYCDSLVSMGYGSKVLFLDGTLTPAEVKERGYAGIDYGIGDFTTHPEWIHEAKSLGLKVCVWTVDNPLTIKEFVEKEVIVTTNKAWRCARMKTNILL